jgi:DNA topoisomerase-3
MGKKLPDAQIKRLAEKGKTLLIKGFKQEDDFVDGFLELTSDFKISFAETEPEKLICPSCKVGEIVKGNTAWGCTNFRGGCKLRVPFELEGKMLTENQIAQLVLKGKTRPFPIIDEISGQKSFGLFLFNASYQVMFQDK